MRMGGYDQELELSIAARADLTWWTDNLKLNNGRPMKTPMIITSNASKTGWGAVCNQQSTGRWSLDVTRENGPHQHTRTESCIPSLKDFYSRKIRYPHSSQDRQFHCNSLYKSQRRNTFTTAVGFSNRDVGVVSESHDDNFSGTHSGNSECSSGQRIEKEIRSKRLEPESASFPADSADLGKTGGRSVRGETQHETPVLLQLSPGSSGRRNRCNDAGLVETEGLCLPNFHHDWEDTQEGEAGQDEGIGTDSPHVEESSLVPSAPEQLDGHSITPPELVRLDTQPCRGESPIDLTGPPSSSRLESVWNRVQSTGISERAFAVVSSACMKGTQKSYQSAWNRYGVIGVVNGTPFFSQPL